MIKPKLLAATLAAATFFTVSVPAFAYETDSSVDSSIECQMENTDCEAETEDVTDSESTEPATADADHAVNTYDITENGTEEEADDEDFGAVQTLNDFKNNAVSMTQSSTYETDVYTNERGQTVYEADNAVAYVNKDGMSGRLYININKYDKDSIEGTNSSYVSKYSISSVGDIALKDIMKFRDNGYVSYIEGKIGEGYGAGTVFYNSGIMVRAAGPESFLKGSLGHLTFTDKSGYSDTLSIFLHKEGKHTLDNDSDNPYVTMVDWFSDGNDEYLDAIYPESPFLNIPDSTENTYIYLNEQGQTVYQAEDMTAYVNPDGISGTLVIDQDRFNFQKNIYTNESDMDVATWCIDSVGDIPINEIMKFNTGGFVHSISAETVLATKSMSLTVQARGPEGILSGRGYMTIKGSDGSNEDINFWPHPYGGYEEKVNLSSDKLTEIEWHS